MSEISESTQQINGHQIYSRTILPETAPIANVLLVHGLGEHCGRYSHVFEFLADNQIAVYSFDQIGHGRSDGKRGNMKLADTWQLMDHFISSIHTADPKVPLFLYGHSLGGNIVLSYAYQWPESLTGVIATSPGIGLANPIPGFLMGIIGLVAKILPGITISNGIKPSDLSQDDQVIQAYVQDPLVHDRISLGLAYDMVTTGKNLVLTDEPFPRPLLLMQGSADKVVDTEAVSQFAKSKASEKLTYHAFQNGYHELQNEPFKEEILNIILDWILSQIGPEAIKRNRESGF